MLILYSISKFWDKTPHHTAKPGAGAIIEPPRGLREFCGAYSSA